jgi:hypothetical protein
MATPTPLPGDFSPGQVLTAANMDNLRGAFRILQVVSGTATTAVGSTSGTYVSTGLSASITPQSTSSKILVFVSHSLFTNVSNTSGSIILRRDSTNLQTFLNLCLGSTASLLITGFNTMFLDSPNTTTALSYNTIQSRDQGLGTFFTQVNANPGTIILLEVSA